MSADLRALAEALITARRQSVRPDAYFWLALDALEAALEAEPRVTVLDAAWREAEAALPAGWELHIGASNGAAAAHANDPASSRAFEFSGAGPTPAAALQALAARLTETAR